MSQFAKINILVFVTCFLLSSCEEEPPGVNYVPSSVSFDTTYILETVPAQEQKEILIEDITGVSCPNCPEAAGIAKSISNANPGRVNILALYNTISGTLGDKINHPPEAVSAYDFKNTWATDITNLVGKPGSLPAGYINRKKFPGKPDPVLAREDWVSSSNAELALTSNVNIDLQAVYNPSSHEVTTEVTITYTGNSSVDNYVSVCLLEDSVVDAQESKDNGDVVYIQNYVHKHILRSMCTAAQGDLLNTKTSITLTKGRVIKRRYVKKFDKIVPYSHIKVLAFVHEDPTSKYIIQSKEIDVAE